MPPTELTALRIKIACLGGGADLLAEMDRLGLHLNAPLIRWLSRVLEATADARQEPR